MAQVVDTKMTLEEQLVLNLCNHELPGNALVELSKVPLAPLLICRLYIPVMKDLAFLFISGEDSCLEDFLVKFCILWCYVAFWD